MILRHFKGFTLHCSLSLLTSKAPLVTQVQGISILTSNQTDRPVIESKMLIDVSRLNNDDDDDDDDDDDNDDDDSSRTIWDFERSQ